MVEFKDYIESIRERANLIEIMLEDVTGLTEHGGVYRGADDWPSLIAWPNGTWRDFGGDRGGDVFDWLMEIRGWSFMAAADYLADRYGIDRMERSVEQEARYVAQHAIGKVLEASFIYYHNALPSKIRNEVLIAHYGFTDETIDRHMLGWAGPQVDHKGRNGRLFEYLRGEGFEQDQCLASGLFVKFKNGKIVDFFADRITFPYWKHGMPKYAIARRCDPYSGDDPHELAKYKKLLTHSEKHPYVSDHIENSIFYNEDAFTGTIDVGLVTEGVTDCISAAQAGIPCISPVTVRFRDKDTEKLVKLARRVKRLVICNDAEASGAGEKGAIKTASILFAQGIDARLAQLPKPDGVEKLDVNEFLRNNSGDELLSVLEHAKRLPEYLIDRVSPATEPSEIGRKLEPAIDVLVGMAAIEQTSYIATIAKRFKVGKSDVKKLIRDRAEFLKKKKRDDAKEDEDKRERLKGFIVEGSNFYFTHNMDGEMVVLSSFKIEPTERVTVEGVEQITGDVITDKNKTIKGVVFPPNAWQGRRQFLAAITRVSPDLQWTGNDDQVQGLLRIVADVDVVKRTGSTMLGWWANGANDSVRWVTPNGIIGPNGIEVDDQLAYVANGSPLAARMKYPVVDDAKVKEIAAEVLPNLMKLNTPAVMLPLIGWYFAAPYRKPITDLLGHFPILWNWGTQGCLAGDTEIGVNRAGKSFRLPIRDLVHRLNGGKAGGRAWDPSIPTMVRAAHDDGTIRLHRLRTAYESGVKSVFLLHTKSGKSIKATRDHRFLTPDGWYRLEHLRPGDVVSIDGGKKKNQTKSKPKYAHTNWLKGHPFTNRAGGNNGGDGKSVPVHRLVFEANLNRIPYDEFVKRLRENDRCNELEFVDPSIHAIHHRNRDSLDNQFENLQKLTHEEHKKLHANEHGWKNCTAQTVEDRIISIRPIETAPTYDLEMDGEPANFIANGFVVHNSGKTSLQLIFWRIHGVTDAEPFSATETEFSMLRLLSSTNGVPIILDEYKPADMLKRNVNRLMRYVRRVYGGETESRGRPDLTLANYTLAAPLSVTGENKPDDPAVLERILCSSPNKNTIELSPVHHRAFAVVRRADLGALALPMIQFAMRAPLTEWLDAARSITNRFLAEADDKGKSIIKGAEDVPSRVVDNLVVMAFGLITYQQFSESLGVELPDPDFQSAIAYQCDDFLEGEAGAKDVFDQFLESLSACAQEGTLREGVHYAGIDGEIALHVQSAYGVYLRERKKMGLEDATNGLRALRRVIREKIERGGYLKRNDARVQLAESMRRCLRIAVTEIPAGLDIEPFPVENEKQWGFQAELDVDGDKS